MSADALRVAIALGSNMLDRAGLLRSGQAAIGRIEGVRLLEVSTVEETEAFGPPQPSYLNQMALVETTLSLHALLHALQAIELQHGRERTVANGPRTLDLDIVWAEQPAIVTDELLVPHPGLNERDFWQRELAELLGVDDAADAITAAQVHTGLATCRHSA
jgi:2-amino-4-hydroxy-6-hydroxymethyldihydropteridine diphosphokinase